MSDQESPPLFTYSVLSRLPQWEKVYGDILNLFSNDFALVRKFVNHERAWFLSSGKMNLWAMGIDFLTTTGILPIENLQPHILEENNESSQKGKRKEASDYVYHEYQYGAPYNVKNYNPHWWNMAGNGEAYETCGAMWQGEYKVCMNLQGHALHGQANGKWVTYKKAVNCHRISCSEDYVKASAEMAMKISERFGRMPSWDYVIDGDLTQTTLEVKLDLTKDIIKTRPISSPVKRTPVKTPESRTPFGKPLHIMVSPSEIDCKLLASSEGDYTLRRKLRRMLKKLGIVGGVIIFHPWRSTKETTPDDLMEFDILNGHYDYELAEKYAKVNGKDSNRWYISPHYHIIGYVDGMLDGEKVAKNYHKTGWIVKNLGVRKSVASTAFYQLTHCGYRTSQETYTWFGVMSASSKWFSQNAFDAPEKTKEKKCPVCSEPMINIVYTGDGEPPLANEPEGIYYIDPFKDYRIVEKLKADTIPDETTTYEEIDMSGYMYVDDIDQ